MQAPFEMTDGLAKLRAIIAGRPPDSPAWNEAQNRFQFIDRLMVECLGWRQPDMRVEDTDADGGRADYILGNPARAVLEAKKEARPWTTLPHGKPSVVRKLKPLLAASKEFSEAVLQVIPYCSLRGTPVAIVCNGPQLAVFQAVVIGQEPLEGECYLFDGLEAYVNFFPLLWTLLSPEGILENRALRDLSRHRTSRMPTKASQSIPEPNQYRYRNNIQEELRQLGSLLLEEIEDNPDLKPEFFRECYVPIEANNRHLLLSKQIIASRYKRVSGDGIAPASLDPATRTGQLSEAYTIGAGSRPIVVVGDVGVGKTSFFENLYQTIGSSEQSAIYFINVNLGSSASLTSDLKQFVLETIPKVLRDKYKVDIFSAEFVDTIYHDELKHFDKSVSGKLKSIDPVEYEKAKIQFLQQKLARLDSHLHAAFSHLAHGRKRRIILVLDNADQRTFDVQQETFIIAQELAATRNMFVFVALRPSTFYLSKTTGALAAYQNKVLTISPPPADEVVIKRIAFALRIAEGKAAPGTLEGIKLNLKSIADFLRATLRSINANENIRQFLTNITGGNTRGVIELITTFCGSPNVEAQKIVEIEATEGGYVVPLHEFTKHALLGEYAYYNPHSSFVACNIFDVSAADPREHFLCSLLIAYLSSNLGIRDNDGFVSGAAIFSEMAKRGFLEEQTCSALVRLASKRLIETPHSHYRELSVGPDTSPISLFFRATTIGIYHVRFWEADFSFLDAMSIDTPVFDEDARVAITKHAASFEIGSRLKKASVFKSYLEAKWHAANFDVTYFDFPSVLEGRGKTFDDVERAVHKRHKPAASPKKRDGRKGRRRAGQNRR